MKKKQGHNLSKRNKLAKMINQVKKLPLFEKQQEDIIATMDMYSGPIPHPKILESD